jgi:hypothetical protein
VDEFVGLSSGSSSVNAVQCLVFLSTLNQIDSCSEVSTLPNSRKAVLTYPSLLSRGDHAWLALVSENFYKFKYDFHEHSAGIGSLLDKCFNIYYDAIHRRADDLSM